MTKNSDPFLITAMGRSGTMFLSSVMNRSAKWTVEHEPERRTPRQVDAALQSRFKPFYGEVNSKLRYVALALDVPKKGVIIREPYDHATSIYKKFLLNKTKPHLRGRSVQLFEPGYLQECFETLDKCVASGMLTIRFEQMTTDPSYLEHVLHRVGIDDVEITKRVTTTPVNRNSMEDIQTWADIPHQFKALFEPQIIWFKERYYGDDARQVPNPV